MIEKIKSLEEELISERNHLENSLYLQTKTTNDHKISIEKIKNLEEFHEVLRKHINELEKTTKIKNSGQMTTESESIQVEFDKKK